ALGVVIDPYVVGVPFVTFTPAVIITALISGFGAGLLSIVASTAFASFFLLPPRGSFFVERVLPYQFDAQTTFTMEADGVHCPISLPTSEHEAIDHPNIA